MTFVLFLGLIQNLGAFWMGGGHYPPPWGIVVLVKLNLSKGGQVSFIIDSLNKLAPNINGISVVWALK